MNFEALVKQLSNRINQPKVIEHYLKVVWRTALNSKESTDEMLIEIVNYDYKSWGFPYVFADYSKSNKKWSITWRNPADFINEKQTEADTLNESCVKALEFIKSNPSIFSRSNQAE